MVLVKALKRLGVHLLLKWPNDLVLGGKKAGGILVEERKGDLLLGVGLNLNKAPEREALSSAGVLSATSLFGYPTCQGPLLWWMQLTEQIRRCFEAHIAFRTPIEILPEIEESMAYRGKQVMVHDHYHGTYRATMLGVDHSGSLRVSVGGSQKIIISGSIVPGT
jgi:BirA family biotin operon repressor/biotin-[acetyl-CoA-carboxylase] ligase